MAIKAIPREKLEDFIEAAENILVLHLRALRGNVAEQVIWDSAVLKLQIALNDVKAEK